MLGGRQGWWLYGRDLSLARSMQNARIEASLDPEFQAYQISLLTYLGAYQDCRTWLERLDLSGTIHARQALCRVRLLEGDRDAWLSLLDDFETLSPLHLMMHGLYANRRCVVVELVGGIGDQLQNSALCLFLSRQGIFRNLLRIRPRGQNTELVSSFLETSEAAPLLFREGEPVLGFISVPYLRIWLAATQEVLGFEALRQVDLPESNPGSAVQAHCWPAGARSLIPTIR